MDASTLASDRDDMDALTSLVIEWGVAGRALDGESGDRCLVKTFTQGALVAVADGLGHGPEAAVAARTAMETLEADADLPVTELLRRCHDQLRPTRGAALSLASFDARKQTMAWVGVGNVDGVLVRASPMARMERLLLLGGVVGRRLPHVHASVLTVSPGDTLILVTDGIRGDFAERLPMGGPAPSAERILARHAMDTDDALVLVVRYRGGESE